MFYKLDINTHELITQCKATVHSDMLKKKKGSIEKPNSLSL